MSLVPALSDTVKRVQHQSRDLPSPWEGMELDSGICLQAVWGVAVLRNVDNAGTDDTPGCEYRLHTTIVCDLGAVHSSCLHEPKKRTSNEHKV